jgi:hypothetical protein
MLQRTRRIHKNINEANVEGKVYYIKIENNIDLKTKKPEVL